MPAKFGLRQFDSLANLPSLPARNPTGRDQDLDPPGLGNPPSQSPGLCAVPTQWGDLALPQLRGPGGALVRGGAGAWGGHHERTPHWWWDEYAVGPRLPASGGDTAGSAGGRRGAHGGAAGGGRGGGAEGEAPHGLRDGAFIGAQASGSGALGGPGRGWARVPRRKNGSCPPVRGPGGRHVLYIHCPGRRQMHKWCSSSRRRRGRRRGHRGARTLPPWWWWGRPLAQWCGAKWRA